MLFFFSLTKGLWKSLNIYWSDTAVCFPKWFCVNTGAFLYSAQDRNSSAPLRQHFPPVLQSYCLALLDCLCITVEFFFYWTMSRIPKIIFETLFLIQSCVISADFAGEHLWLMFKSNIRIGKNVTSVTKIHDMVLLGCLEHFRNLWSPRICIYNFLKSLLRLVW